MTREIAYRALAAWLRLAIRHGDYADDTPLPTEKQLMEAHGVSRQTVRRAMQDLVSEGSIYRVPGRGTYVLSDRDPYVYQIGAVEDLVAMYEPTECEIITPLHLERNAAMADRLRLPDSEVMALSLRRWQGRAPFCLANVAIPPQVGELLLDVEDLTTKGRRSSVTVISLIDSRLHLSINAVEQNVSAIAAPPGIRRRLRLDPTDPVLRVERRYFDAAGKAIECVETYFDSKRYTYQFNARRRSG